MIFATNLVSNCDKAFETRVRHLFFPLPDQATPESIWQRHLPERLTLKGTAQGLDGQELTVFLSRVKSKLFEIRYAKYLNSGHLPDGRHSIHQLHVKHVTSNSPIRNRRGAEDAEKKQNPEVASLMVFSANSAALRCSFSVVCFSVAASRAAGRPCPAGHKQ